MKTVQELLIAICDDLQEYLNDTPITEMQIEVTTRLLEMLNDFKVLYVDTDSVKVPLPDPDDAEDKDAEDPLEDFDTGAIEYTMEQPTDYNTRKPYRPVLRGIYRLAGTHSYYQCIAVDDVNNAYTMRNINSRWTCIAHNIGIYSNFCIDWAYSSKGHYEK